MNSDSDLQIAGDILEVPHLLQAPREHPATVADFVGLARSIAADRAQWAHLVRVRRDHPLVPPAAHRARLRGVAAVLGPRTGQRAARPRPFVRRADRPGGRADRARRERGTRALAPATQRVFAPGYVHEVVNDALEPAVSLHVYFPGLTEMPMHAARCAPSAVVTG